MEQGGRKLTCNPLPHLTDNRTSQDFFGGGAGPSFRGLTFTERPGWLDVTPDLLSQKTVGGIIQKAHGKKT